MERENQTSAAHKGRYWLGLCVLFVALAAAAYLLSQHWGHVVGYWLYLLLLACPLMHLFMHRGHGGHH
jgi:hypothetical protein